MGLSIHDRHLAWRYVSPVVGLAICLVAVTTHAQEPSALLKERAKKLDQMALSLEEVDKHEESSSGNRTGDERRSSQQSELRFKFLNCAAGLANSDKDGMLLFPIQVSGFSSAIDGSGGAPKRTRGSDYQSVKVTLAGIADPKPKAKIDLPKLSHGSTFNAEQLARDEIIRRIRWYFPEADIEGRQRFNEKRLTLKNETKENLRVWVKYRTLERQEKGFEWVWKPGDKSASSTLELTIEPGKSAYVEGEDKSPIVASRVRFWAETESGEQYDEHKSEELWLVDENPQLDGDRAYYDEKHQTYTYTFKPKTGSRKFTERVVDLQNTTDEPLTVQLRYHFFSAGKLVWRTSEFELGPGQTLAPRGDDGLRVRASRLYVKATTDNRRYEKYAEKPLWMVEETSGQRAYMAEGIGKYQLIFTPAGEGAGTNLATVKRGGVKVMSGTTELGVLEQKEAVAVVDKRPGWVKVRKGDGDSAIAGWVKDTDVDVQANEAGATPASRARRSLTTNFTGVNVQVGATVLGALERGRAYEVLEERAGWYRVEFPASGSGRHGWVKAQQVQVK